MIQKVMVASGPWHLPEPSARRNHNLQHSGELYAPHVSSLHLMILSLTALAAYAGTLDLIFVGLAWKTILSLQMKMREKVGVALAMSMGIL